MMDIHLGLVVTSVAGRDKGRLFAVVGVVDENYVLIADGKLRRLEEPKRKKVKHIRSDGSGWTIETAGVTNRLLREALGASDA